MFMEFVSFSRLKINFAKSDIMQLTKHPLSDWKTEVPLAISKSHITCLGTKIGSTPASIYYLKLPTPDIKNLEVIRNVGGLAAVSL